MLPSPLSHPGTEATDPLPPGSSRATGWQKRLTVVKQIHAAAFLRVGDVANCFAVNLPFCDWLAPHSKHVESN